MRFVIGACALLLGTAAFGTTLVYRDLADLSRTSDAVVRGKVVQTQSRWTADRSKIVTDVTIEVAETLKGAPGRTVTIVQPGGSVGHTGQKVAGLASFETGEEVVVFLEKRGDDRFEVNGLAQGKYRVERSSDGKAAYAVPDKNVEEAVVVDPVTRVPAEVHRPTVKLETLKTDVQKALSGAPERPAAQKRPQGGEVQ